MNISERKLVKECVDNTIVGRRNYSHKHRPVSSGSTTAQLPLSSPKSKEQDNDRYAWLKNKQHTYTASLESRMKAMSLHDEERRKYSFIQHTILFNSKKYRDQRLYVNIYHDVFRAKIGANYRDYIDDLEQWGELDINKDKKTGKRKYRKTKRDENGKVLVKGYTLSYRIPMTALASGLITRDYRSGRLRNVQDHSTASGPMIEYFKKNASHLTIKEMDIKLSPKEKKYEYQSRTP